MSPEVCRDLFRRGAHAADLALIEGQFFPAAGGGMRGGRLEPLCRWLDLPRLIVIDSTHLGPCNLPPRPRRGDGLLLDCIVDERHLACLTTELESLWGIPVLGALEQLPGLRRELKRTAVGGRVPHDVCVRLGDHLAAFTELERIWELALLRDLPEQPARCHCFLQLPSKLTVAIAYDEAFHRYFPDTLDLLELRGATVVDFSPLRDETLPEGTDIVYLGCGHPERYAKALSENHCIGASLRNHVRSGGRIYAEGGGAAYLCQQMETPQGELRRMAGILPAVARPLRPPVSPVPVELTLAQPSWLGLPGTKLRGYRNANWRFEPAGPPAGLIAETMRENDLVGSFSVIGSLLHLNFAAQPLFLHQFFFPHCCRHAIRDPWAAAR